MDESYKIINNVLDKEYFLEIKNIFESNKFSWYFCDKVNSYVKEEDLFSYFTTLIYSDEEKLGFSVNVLFKYMFPILNVIQPKKLIRIKANLYTKTKEIEYHPLHQDYPFEHKGAIYYINSNDGKTVINNGKVEIDSVENSLLLFNSHLPHGSTSTSNKNTRINININYI
jgi:hypothetical protein